MSGKKTLEPTETVGGSQPARTVFIVEDHPVFREGLAQLISKEPDLTLCGQAGDYEAAMEGISRLKPDLVLVDITLPGKSGLDLIKALRPAQPRLKMLAVSMHDEAVYANRVLRLGGDGYIMKQEDPREIINAMRDVLAGHIYVSEEVMGSRDKDARPPEGEPERPLDRLTDSQLEILELLGKGESNEEIAGKLRLTVEKLAEECADMRKRLKLKSNNALIHYAVCWVQSGED